MTVPVASIPSPSSGVFHIGPLVVHLYGLTLLVAILLCVWLTSVRWRRMGGDGDLVLRVALWGVGFGVIGARLYHDITSWDEVPTPKWQGVFELWHGGLGVWGGILFGTIAGRIGNWWNQELFGKPTSLPWGLRIDADHRPLQYLSSPTFHPTFLYELVWDLAGVALLIWVDRRWRIRPPGLFALYVAYYCFGRFFEELLRIDPSYHFAGLRVNAWVSVVLFVGALIFFIWWQVLGRGGSAREGPPKTKPRPQPDPARPKMSVPKGRVR